MTNILMREISINKEDNCFLGQTDIYESFTDKIGTLFKDCQKEYGRCISSIYIDKKSGQTLKIGWVFQKRQKYSDCDETYLHETWIELHTKEPKKTVKYFYKKLQ